VRRYFAVDDKGPRSVRETVERDVSCCLKVALDIYNAIEMSQCWLEPCTASPRCCSQPGGIPGHERTIGG
jgi:hypothetical protein